MVKKVAKKKVVRKKVVKKVEEVVPTLEAAEMHQIQEHLEEIKEFEGKGALGMKTLENLDLKMKLAQHDFKALQDEQAKLSAGLKSSGEMLKLKRAAYQKYTSTLVEKYNIKIKNWGFDPSTGVIG